MIDAVLIKGPLDGQDVAELSEALRKIERRKPHVTFTISVHDDCAGTPMTDHDRTRRDLALACDRNDLQLMIELEKGRADL